MDNAEAAVRDCNPTAAIQRTSHARVEVASWLTTRTWDTVWGFDRDDAHRHDAAAWSSATHTEGVGSLALSSAWPIELSRLQAWLRSMVDDPNIDIMRIKGIVRCPQYAEAVIVQGVYQWFDMRLAESCGPQDSILVVIGRGLNREAIRQGWSACQVMPQE